jgi:hypothetical protein
MHPVINEKSRERGRDIYIFRVREFEIYIEREREKGGGVHELERKTLSGYGT